MTKQPTKRVYERIMEGLEEARAYLDGTADKRHYRVHVPTKIDVRKIRTRLGLSQKTFARTYGFALSAVRDWEQGRRRPERSARILLKVVEKEPEAVTRALVGRTVADVERDLILETLKHCLGNRTHAANILGISIRTLRNKLNEYAGDGVPIPPPANGEVRGAA